MQVHTYSPAVLSLCITYLCSLITLLALQPRPQPGQILHADSSAPARARIDEKGKTTQSPIAIDLAYIALFLSVRQSTLKQQQNSVSIVRGNIELPFAGSSLCITAFPLRYTDCSRPTCQHDCACRSLRRASLCLSLRSLPPLFRLLDHALVGCELAGFPAPNEHLRLVPRRLRCRPDPISPDLGLVPLREEKRRKGPRDRDRISLLMVIAKQSSAYPEAFDFPTLKDTLGTWSVILSTGGRPTAQYQAPPSPE